MRISKLRIENFRSIKYLELDLDETTVFIGPNNTGKTAILEAVRIGLSRRWGQRGTGFTEHDVHLLDESADPRTASPVRITLEFQEPEVGSWPSDMVADLEQVMSLSTSGLNKISLTISYTWNSTKEIFEPSWEFLNASGVPLPPQRRSINLSGFYDYIFFLWLGALRDIDEEFSTKSRHWGGLLKAIKIPPSLEEKIKKTLDDLDSDLLASDPKLSQIAQTIGKSTEVAIQDNRTGAAKLRMLPLNAWDMLARAAVILRNGEFKPWLPLDHHGQGLQSLAIIFLFQAAAAQQIEDGLSEGTEPIFAIEEPEAHLHPQAARTLWKRISDLSGQKLVTTHSPYFVQNVPMHNLRIVRLRDGSTKVYSIPKHIHSSIPWSQELDDLVRGKGLGCFVNNPETNTIQVNAPFTESIADDIKRCFARAADKANIEAAIDSLRHDSRLLITPEDEAELSFFGRRVRGEIFFANRWVLVEGPCEYLLLNALAEIKGYDFDQNGVAIIDFQNNGNAGIYPAIADALGIPWRMFTDGDPESEKFKKQLLKRGFHDGDLAAYFCTLTPPNNLEDQLIADGNEALLREVLRDIGDADATSCSLPDLKKKLKKDKTGYIGGLCTRLLKEPVLAEKMPKIFLDYVDELKQ